MTTRNRRGITVIVPTRAQPARHALLRRAVDSILSQSAVDAVPLIVVNGGQSDSGLIREWRSDARVRVATIDCEDLPTALQVGRRLVRTPFFGELDDDDMLLPNALATRLRALTECDDCDAVVTNGFHRTARGDCLHITDVAAVGRDPLRALLTQNWLLPGSWLCRADRVDERLFDGMPRYRECTYLAVVLATKFRVAFVEEPTVVYHADTVESESKSRAYILGGVAADRRLLELEMPADVRAQLRRKCLASDYRSIGSLHLAERRFVASAAAYLRSGLQPGGLRYLLRRSIRQPADF